ncbi:MAG TPA: hypothetical protein VLI04_19955 [Nocardioidaceae bacterium]|nr:hypothetical protein [Nocardioidaceae bacterium]
MIRPALAVVAGCWLLAACGGGDSPGVLPEVSAFDEARDTLLATDAGGYSWTVRIDAFPKPLVREDVCWDSASGRPPALEALAAAEAYGAHRGDSSLVDVDIPASLALSLLGVESKLLERSPLEPDDFAPVVVGVSDGHIASVSVNGAAVARRLDSDDVPVNADLRSHAQLAVAEVVLGESGCTP